MRALIICTGRVLVNRTIFDLDLDGLNETCVVLYQICMSKSRIFVDRVKSHLTTPRTNKSDADIKTTLLGGG